MLLVDEDVGHAALVGHLLKSVLDVGAIVYTDKRSAINLHRYADIRGRRLTNLVELKSVELGAGLGQKLLGGLAVGAVRLGEDGCKESASRLRLYMLL